MIRRFTTGMAIEDFGRSRRSIEAGNYFGMSPIAGEWRKKSFTWPVACRLDHEHTSRWFASLALVLFLLVTPVLLYAAETNLESQAGFTEIEQVDIYFRKPGNRLELKSSPARLWSVFMPASKEPDSMPLLVFFNGGPGCATSSGLMSFNTGTMTVDPQRTGTDKIAKNRTPWTRLGNILYVDARQSGFSYSLMRNPEREGARWREFQAQNCNAFVDGADVIRVLIRFLARNPAIRSNPVVLVGESYGGVRATVMLHMLLNYRDYGSDKAIYQDKALVKEIQAHYDVVFPKYKGKPVPARIIAQQFGRQVLVQPSMAGAYQDAVAGEMFEKKGSVIYRIAHETDRKYKPCGADATCIPYDNALSFVDYTARRDVYDYSKPYNWLLGIMDKAGNRIQSVGVLSNLTGADVTSIKAMYASRRTLAYRHASTPTGGSPSESGSSLGEAQPVFDKSKLPIAQRLRLEHMEEICTERALAAPGNMASVFGALKPWDEYFLTCNDSALYGFYDNQAISRGYAIDPSQPIYARMFLKNVAQVKTFITHADRDLVVYAPALPKALAKHKGILSSARHDTRPRPGIQRPGWIILSYRPGAFSDEPGLKSKTIRFPIYKGSSHAVTANEPEALRSDVAAWLKQ